MFLIILGIIVFVIGSAALKAETQFSKLGNPIRITGLVVLIIGVLTSSVRQVDAGHVGVKSLFGKVQQESLPSGLSFINPLMDVTTIDVRTLNYTMSGIHDEGTKAGDDAIKVLTSDGLEVTIDLSVLYRVNPVEAPRMLREIGVDFEDKIVRPITRTRIRDNSVYYEAIALYSTKRDEFQSRIFN
jgi:regulator of protease activity HflC (stomatin/prohibitin superfamily)